MPEQPPGRDQTPSFIPLSEAAARLGVTVDALRARLRRDKSGTLRTTRGNDGRLLVALPGGHEASAPPSSDDADALLGELAEARAEAERWRTEAEQARHAQVRAEAELGAERRLAEELRALLHEARKPWLRRVLERWKE